MRWGIAVNSSGSRARSTDFSTTGPNGSKYYEETLGKAEEFLTSIGYLKPQ